MGVELVPPRPALAVDEEPLRVGPPRGIPPLVLLLAGRGPQGVGGRDALRDDPVQPGPDHGLAGEVGRVDEALGAVDVPADAHSRLEQAPGVLEQPRLGRGSERGAQVERQP